MVTLDTSTPIWDQFFTVAPLVVIGTKEFEGYDLAPKHMVTPLGKQNYFGFVCTPNHRTYHNVKKTGYFTVSFPRPNQILLTSLAASPRCGDDLSEKPIVNYLPTIPAINVDALFVKDSYLYLECQLDKIIDGFGEHSLIAGKISGAYVVEDSIRSSEVDEQELVHNAPMLAYIANGRFAEIQQTFAFPFPKDFKV